MKFCQSYPISEIEDSEKESIYTTVVQFRISLYLWYTLPQDRSDQQTTVHSVVRVTRSLVLCVRFVESC
jgi:hypothetical protein